MSTIQCSCSISGILQRDLLERAMEQAVRDLHDVVFGEARDFFTLVRARVLERVANDALAAGARDQFEALRDLIGLPVLDAAVDVFLVLANDDDVHVRMLGRDVRVQRRAGAHVGVHAQRLAHRDVEALEAAALRRRDRRLEKDLRPAQRFPGRWLDAVASRACRRARRCRSRSMSSRAPAARDDAQRSIHDLRSDAVAVGDGHGDFLRGRDRGGQGGLLVIFRRPMRFAASIRRRLLLPGQGPILGVPPLADPVGLEVVQPGRIARSARGR